MGLRPLLWGGASPPLGIRDTVGAALATVMGRIQP